MIKKYSKLILVIALISLLLTGCMAQRAVTPDKSAGFFMGIWHGWIAPIALIIGVFNKSVTIYEVNNTGWWYDFGYYMAIISGFGGLTLSRKKKKD
jgi:hypothetical protein